MVKEINVRGFQQLIETVESEDLKGKSIFCLFCGDKDAEGKSWCPDCVVAEPVVRRCLKQLDDSCAFVYCTVGGRDYWNDKNNEFRIHSSLKLTGVPTLLKWGFPNQKLVENQLFKEDLIMMMLDDC